MRYTQTLLLTTTLLTTSFATYGAESMAPSSQEHHSTATKETNVIAPAVQAKIDALNTLVSATAEFNVSDAAEILFSPELYPSISWRSATKDPATITEIRQLIGNAFRQNFNRNTKFVSYLLTAILFEDFLEKEPLSYDLSTAPNNPTFLNELVEASICWGYYTNVQEHFHLTFTPLVRLKIYLELIHQTNITPDSLKQILNITSKLAQSFMTDPNAALTETPPKSTEVMTKQIGPTESGSYEYYSPTGLDTYSGATYPYPSLKNAHRENATPEETIQSLSWVSKRRSETLADFEAGLDNAFQSKNEMIARILSSFGPDALNLFQEIFQRIAVHPQTKPEDKLNAEELLIQAGGDSALLINSRFAVATDSAVDIQDRLIAAKKLLQTTGASEKAVQAYNHIIESLTTDPAENNDAIHSILIEAGVGLHTAGATDPGLKILSQQFRWLIPKIQQKQYVTVNTSSMITATEILFNAGKFKNKETAINLISWAVYKGFLVEAILAGAETAERIGDVAASQKFLNYFKTFKKSEGFEDRLNVLQAKLLDQAQ